MVYIMVVFTVLCLFSLFLSLQGAVGINNDAPSEALCVDGNMRVTGSVLQPSDRRVKENIAPTNTAAQLNNIRQLPLYVVCPFELF